jgi:hydrogenase-1 operon protein HyaF
MSRFPIPVVVIGPGSQPEEEEPLQYIASPGDMSVFRPPAPRRQASAQAAAGAQELLGRLLTTMETQGFDSPTTRLPLASVDAEVLDEVNESLGSGEVSVIVSAPRILRIQECAFAGVWRVQTLAEDGTVLEDDIETGAIPGRVHEALAAVAAPIAEPKAPPLGVMNAPTLLRELRSVAADYRPGNPAHIVNLTLLPLSPEDLEYLAVELGGGPVTILSRGYGNCRITSTAVPHTWWVQYFNSMDQLILNTLEVVDVPAVALAAHEDFSDSIERLREWRATL